MTKFHNVFSQWGLVSGIRQARSDLITVVAQRSPFAVETRKGQLVLLVEAEGDVSRGRHACELVACTIQDAFYRDGSMSITSSLRSALKSANAALYQHNFSAPPHKRALVGVSCAVIHGGDLFLTQAPPAQAFLAHAGKLRALPVPLSWTNGADTSSSRRQGALGTSLGSEPEFFRSVLQPGDTLVLCSSNIARLIGKDEAEQLIGFSDAETIAEELYAKCRSANLPEAHAIAVEAVPGPAPAHADEGPPRSGTPARGGLRGLFGRGVANERPAEPPAVSEAPTAPPSRPQPPVVLLPQPQPAPAVTQTLAALPEPPSVWDRLPLYDAVALPPSAFVGEDDYGGTIRPPAAPRRSRQVDLSDNIGTPVDFAALPKRAEPPPPGAIDRMTLPLRSAMASLDNQLANLPRRTARPAERGPASGLKLKGLTYRRTRPRIPWINIVLIVGVVALLIGVGMQWNRRRDDQGVALALEKVDAAVAAARNAANEAEAQRQLASADEALSNDIRVLIEQGLITTTKPLAWSRYLAVRERYDSALAAINKIGIVNDLEEVAALPAPDGLVSRLVLGTTQTLSDTAPLYYVDRGAGLLYQAGQAEPILRPDLQIGPFATGPVRDALWREGAVIAFDRGDPVFPIYRVYLRSGDEWLTNQLNKTEQMQPADTSLPMASFGGHLYIWDATPGQLQLWKYDSGAYANLPNAWITNTGGQNLDQVVDLQIDGRVWMLNRDASILIYEGGNFVARFEPPELTTPITSASRFIVTPDTYAEDGSIAVPGYIYMLDTRNERILQLTKTDGTLVQQIQARSRGQLNVLSDIAVDEARQLIYFANGPRVLQAVLPEPPQPAPEPEATEGVEN